MADAADPRSSYVALDGLRLHLLEWGAPDAAPIVLLHALGALVTAHDWDGFAAAMQGTHRVIAPDQRGFGLSDRMSAYTFELMARDLAQIVEFLDLDRFTLIGHSMGGYVAAVYAEACPDRLGQLVLEDTVPPRDGRRIDRTDDLPWEFDGFDELLAFARQQGLRASDDELLARFAHATRTVDGGRVAFRLDPALPPAILAQLADPDPAWWRDLSRIAVPALIVRGADSPVLDAEQASLAAAAIASCRVVEVPRAGHSVHHDNPTGFLEAVRSFLRPADAVG
jgi:pimeloyl-ACP methyl ester carboxylesterase